MNRNEDAAIIEHRLGFGRAVQTLRKHRNLSQEALALTASIDRSYMGRIERGEQSISLDKIWAICDALEISILRHNDRAHLHGGVDGEFRRTGSHTGLNQIHA